MVIIFWDILMFKKIFVAPQVKGGVIVSNKDGIYELPHNVLRNLKQDFRKLGNIRKISKFYRILV